MNEKKLEIALLNDSFHPCIDGVANVTMNYARELNKFATPVVITPYYPGAVDSYPFEVIRYPSINIAPQSGYRVGLPFHLPSVHAYHGHHFDIVHSHCPVSSGYLARYMQVVYRVPVVFTYHTKFDVDLATFISSDTVMDAMIKLMISNISACDDVWVVSEGAGRSLRQIGYRGDYSVMKNGVDIPKKRAEDDAVFKLRAAHNIPPENTVFLFVGRMRWYKGIRLILDGMARAKAAGHVFTTIFVGNGSDKEDMIAYAQKLGLMNEACFAGAIYDRELLSAYYTLASLLLFPSAYDTNGLVVGEAAACSLGSVLLKGSCAAEGVTDGRNGFTIGENPDEMGKCIAFACDYPERARQIGESAANELYISWETSVRRAYVRYQEIINAHKRKMIERA